MRRGGMAECAGKRRRWRYRATGIDHQVGQRALVVLDEDGSMLEESAVTSLLRASRELLAVEHELAGGRHVEAGRRAGRCGTPTRCGELGSHTKSVQTGDQDAI